jgi:diguanylate cyclase
MAAPDPENPSACAREALKQLGAKRLPPTPENFARAYFELAPGARAGSALGAADMLRQLAAEWPRREADGARTLGQLEQSINNNDWESVRRSLTKLAGGGRSDSGDGAWADIIRDLARLIEVRHAGLTPTRKRESLDHVLGAFGGDAAALYPRLKGLLRTWADTPIARESALTEEAASADALSPSAHEAASQIKAEIQRDEEIPALLRELLAQTLTFGVVERLGYSPELSTEARTLAQRVREAKDRRGIGELADRLKHFWIALEIRGEDQQEVQQGLLRLLHLLMNNVGELVAEDRWLKGQLEALSTLTANPLDRAGLANVERGLREVVFKQGTLKHSLDEAKAALKDMLVTFIDRLGTLSTSTGDYHGRIEKHARALQSTDDLAQLSSILRDVMQETRAMQGDIARSHDELVSAKRRADDYEQKVHVLEQELETVSALVQEDQLTSTLNRRGLDNAYEQEVARSERRATPLSLAILDLDNFKNLNDTLGHHAGDQALVHLAGIIRRTLRPTDVIARYGGEEFVLLFPETVKEEAAKVMVRLQRELTRRFFLHDNQRVLITFSAGVAQRTKDENQEALVERADRALYRAKQAGKNRVFTTDT